MSLIDDIRDGLRGLGREERDLERFAVVISSALLLIAVLIFWLGRNPGRSLWFTGAAIFVILTALFAPRLLMPLYNGWMALAFFLGGVMSRLILTLLFYLVLAPIGLLMRLFGKDLLKMKRPPTAESLWRPRPEKNAAPESYKRLF